MTDEGKIDSDMSKTGAYELSYLIDPIVGDDNMASAVGKIQGIIEQDGGKVTYSDTPRLRNLAYTIEKAEGGKRKKFNQGYFGWLRFESGSSVVEKIAKEVNAEKTVIRSLLIHAPKKDVAPIRTGIRKTTPTATTAGEGAVKPTEAEIEKEVENLIASTNPVSAPV